MIQRKQSLFLLLAAILGVLVYLFPIAVFNLESGVFELFSCHINGPDNVTVDIPVIVSSALPILSSVLSFVSIFLFKKRKLQLKFGKLNLFVLFIYHGVAAYFIYSLSKTLGSSPEINLALPFAFLAIVFVLLAQNGIKKDEALVRAADRIR